MGHLMQTYNIHDAKTQLSRLVEQAARGESFVIAKAGKPMVKVTALDAPGPADAHAVAIGMLPPIHKDPFDRLLIAQATVEGITLLTDDAIVATYPGPILLA